MPIVHIKEEQFYRYWREGYPNTASPNVVQTYLKRDLLDSFPDYFAGKRIHTTPQMTIPEVDDMVEYVIRERIVIVRERERKQEEQRKEIAKSNSERAARIKNSRYRRRKRGVNGASDVVVDD